MAHARVEGVFELASALTVFAGDLHKLPEQLNPSTLRTFGQAADFLATMLDDLHRGRTRAIDTARVLIVEDDAAAGQMIQAAMQFVGLRSVWADSPATSLDRLARESFDLIFLDVGLPQMSGFDLCSKVRTLELHEKTPVVFLTGMATFQNRVQSSLSGGNDFVGKPFNLPELGVKALIWVFKGHLGLT
jgi:CheY-like chemotaxis protein